MFSVRQAGVVLSVSLRPSTATFAIDRGFSHASQLSRDTASRYALMYVRVKQELRSSSVQKLVAILSFISVTLPHPILVGSSTFAFCTLTTKR